MVPVILFIYFLIIHFFNKFQLIESTKLPQKICNKCAKEIEKFTKLKSLIKDTQMQLMEMIQSEIKTEDYNVLNVKIEPYDFVDNADSNCASLDDFDNFSPVNSSIKEEEASKEIEPNKVKRKYKRTRKPRNDNHERNLPIHYSAEAIFSCDFCGLEINSKKELILHLVSDLFVYYLIYGSTRVKAINYAIIGWPS